MSNQALAEPNSVIATLATMFDLAESELANCGDMYAYIADKTGRTRAHVKHMVFHSLYSCSAVPLKHTGNLFRRNYK